MLIYSISELAREFAVSTRTIRYYEEMGLICPERNQNSRRIFTKKDYARLKLIMRGKRFGFQLNEIKEMVLLFDQDPTGQKQLVRTLGYGKEKILEINERIEELQELKIEMEEMMRRLEAGISLPRQKEEFQ
ncbi:MerR family transcriptional regulator [Mesobacillus harenae]|uniref:MerR family transcriptional regulator n=1 Tax=Mesobacillus harenae TaxID=2213203 RepID=UPI001580A3A4|nr:MerR family DNA-binding transcriptional regulator [Mesobacillus harenae]